MVVGWTGKGSEDLLGLSAIVLSSLKFLRGNSFLENEFKIQAESRAQREFLTQCEQGMEKEFPSQAVSRTHHNC